jgi:glyoxylase-like metal-dependent hydrolase (beta-lactamase superfamily II)
MRISPLAAGTGLALVAGLGLSVLAGRAEDRPAPTAVAPVSAAGSGAGIGPGHGRDPGVSLSLIETGADEGPEGIIREGGSIFVKRETTVVAFLVRHPKAVFLFDSGYGKHARPHYDTFPLWAKLLLGFRQTGDTASILAANAPSSGIDPAKIAYLIPSHLHWDHASAIKDFPETEVMVQRSELEFAQRNGPPRSVRSQWDGDLVKWKFFELTGGPYHDFAKSLDLFGDQTCVLVPLPGHTPGSVGLFLTLADGRKLFLTGDTGWIRESFTHVAGRSWLIQDIFDDDVAENRRSLQQVHDLMAKQPAIAVIPAHDKAAQAQLAHFPKFMP